MPAPQFEIDPQATRSGLTMAGLTRSQAIAAGVPALPGGTYIAGYSTAAGAVLGTLGARVSGTVVTGMAKAVETTTTVETTEAQNQTIVST